MAVDEEEARYKAAMAEMEAPTIGELLLLFIYLFCNLYVVRR